MAAVGSPAIKLDYRGWKNWEIPAAAFAYRCPAGETVSDAPKLSTVDAFGLDFDDRGENVLVDNLIWSSSISGIDPVVVDDFETGNFAAWQEHGTPETTANAHTLLDSDRADVQAGRVAFRVSFAAAKQVRMQALA